MCRKVVDPGEGAARDPLTSAVLCLSCILASFNGMLQTIASDAHHHNPPKPEEKNAKKA